MNEKEIKPVFDDCGVGFCSEGHCPWSVESSGSFGGLFYHCGHSYVMANKLHPKRIDNRCICYPWLLAFVGKLQMKGCGHG